MKRLSFTAAIAAAITTAIIVLPCPARALPAGVAYTAFIDEGPIFIDVGSLQFFFLEATSAKLGSGWNVVCRYVMLWSPPRGTRPYATSCAVDELTWQGRRDCVANAQTSLPTIIMRVPNAPCAGFDYNGLAHDLFQLVAGESDEGLYGLVQYTAASAEVTGFRAYSP